MKIGRIDRSYIFLCIIFLLYLWDLAFLVGIRDPARLLHPFSVFTTPEGFEFLRGFSYMLREIIFAFASGGVVGAAIGSSLLYSLWLTSAALRCLRIARWLPLLFIYATAPMIWEIAASTLSIVYHYLAGRALLYLQARDAWIYAARESLIQTLLVSLLAQLWVENWRWSGFLIMNRPETGFQVFAALVVLVGLVNWAFRASFAQTADRHARTYIGLLDMTHGKSTYQFIFLSVGLVIIWQFVGPSGLSAIRTGPLEVTKTIHQLFSRGEIWEDLRISLLEVFGGIALSGVLCAGLFLLLTIQPVLKKVLLSLLPLTHLSAIVLWLIAFTWIGVNVWHKVIAVACFTFFVTFETLWSIRKHPFSYRVLVTTDTALPIALVGMIFGEAMAATAGLGFAMIVANATSQADRTMAVFLITVSMLVGLSGALRWAIKRSCRAEEAIPEATAD